MWRTTYQSAIGGDHRKTEDDDLIGIDPHRTERPPADLGNGTEAGGRENRVGTRDVDVHVVDQNLDDVQHQRGNGDKQTDGRDEARGLARSDQTAEDDSVEQQAEPGREDDDGDDGRRDDRPVQPGVHFVVDECRGKGDRAVGEVEDA